MNTLTEQLEQLAELQKKSLEPLHRFNNDALAAYERVARKNHELIGDMVDFAVAQSRSQIEGDSPQDVYERQVAEAKAFAEKISSRAAEYAELAAELKENALGNLSSAADMVGDQATKAKPAAKRSPKASTSESSKTSASAKSPATKKRAAKAVSRAASKTSSKGKSKASSKASGKVGGKKSAARAVSGKKKSAGKRRAAANA